MIYLTLFWEFFKIGLFTIGGGYAMYPLIRQTTLENCWLDEQTLVNFVGVSEGTPGPFAINLATFVGMHTCYADGGVFGGLLGAFCATAGVVLPSLLIIIAVCKLFSAFSEAKFVKGLLYGARPAALGLVFAAAVTVFLSVILPNVHLDNLPSSTVEGFSWLSLVLFGVFFALSRIKIKDKKVHPLLLIAFSAVVGILLFGVLGL